MKGDQVAIQYEGRLGGQQGSLFHATQPTQPFVFVVRAGQFTAVLINCHFLLTQVQTGRALPGLVAGLYRSDTIGSSDVDNHLLDDFSKSSPSRVKISAGVRGMCRGEIRSLHLPVGLAWGEQPPQPLPANASVHYKVSL